MRKVIVVLLLMMGALVMSGCYWNEDVQPNEVGVQLKRNAINAVVSSGVYTDMGWFSDLKVIDVGTQTFTVQDPEVMTADNQAVGLVVTIQARRKSDNDSIRNLVTNWASLAGNESMVQTISATAREGMKNGVRGFTLTQLLDDRNGLSAAIREQLEIDSAKYSVEIINVTIENIAIDPEYMATLKQKALLRAETEKEIQRQELIKQTAANDILQAQKDSLVLAEQLLVQQAQTAVDVEIASREGKKIEATNKIYQINTQAYELERLRLLATVIGDKTVFYVPSDMSIMQILGNMSGTTVVPVP